MTDCWCRDPSSRYLLYNSRTAAYTLNSRRLYILDGKFDTCIDGLCGSDSQDRDSYGRNNLIPFRCHGDGYQHLPALQSCQCTSFPFCINNEREWLCRKICGRRAQTMQRLDQGCCLFVLIGSMIRDSPIDSRRCSHQHACWS